MVLAGLSAAWLLGFGLGMCLMALSMYFPVTDQLVPILLRPMFFVSGLFFAANDFTDGAAEITCCTTCCCTRWSWCVMAGSSAITRTTSTCISGRLDSCAGLILVCC